NSPLLTKSPGTRSIIETLLEKNLHALQWQNNIVVQVKEQLFAYAKQDHWPSADQLAEALLISARTLSRRLAENGYTLSSLIEEVRMEKADILLMSSTMPIVKVAHKLGYSDISTFSRAYKRVRKINPSNVRSQLRTTPI
ncbi:MAG: AraC family transcriptional regulator, partial [Moraxellaceae bacterium]